MMIEVSPDHIERGARWHSFRNPVALAIQEQRDKYAVVTNTRIHFACNHRNCRLPFCGVFMAPVEVTQFLSAWNMDRPVSPFRFTI